MTRTSHPERDAVIDEIDRLMSDFPHTKKDIGYGIRWTFKNRMRFDIIDYRKQGKIILRVGRGAWLVYTYPVLGEWFDSVSKVIAKLEIHDATTLHDKHFAGIIQLLADAPTHVPAQV